MTTFHKSFTQQEAIPDDGIEAAVAVMRTGRLHRYNLTGGEAGETALLESEFADYLGVPFCLACASGGYALHIALRSLGLADGEPVLTNAFTLSPVPGAIHNAGGRPVLVEIGADYTIDPADLRAMAAQSGSRVLMLSHMRGHIGDMDAILDVCREFDMHLIEDCAHTMGARWNGRPSGTFGRIGCFSTQTYKHINSGEGGLLVTEDPEIARRAVILSGSYMLYDRHRAVPPAETFRSMRLEVPNYSGRMDNLRAAVLRPQLRDLDERCRRWNVLYGVLADRLSRMAPVRMPARPAAEAFVGSSIQFSLPDFDVARIRRFVSAAEGRGVAIKWFGAAEPVGYTSRYDSWHYLGAVRELPRTLDVLSTLCDLRIPLTFDRSDCGVIADVIQEALDESRTSDGGQAL